MKYIPGSFSHLFSLFYGSQVLSSLPLLSWLVNSRGIKQKSSFLCKLKICIYGIYVPFSGFMRIRPVWSEWQGWVILGEKTKILCLQVPIKYTCIVCVFWYSTPLKLPLLKMSSDWKIPFIAQKRLFVCTRSTRISMEYQCVNDSCLFEENPSEFLAQSNINACFKFKERKFNFIYWIGDFKSCMYIVFEMGWFKDLSEELWGWKFGPKL